MSGYYETLNTCQFFKRMESARVVYRNGARTTKKAIRAEIAQHFCAVICCGTESTHNHNPTHLFINDIRAFAPEDWQS